MEETKRYTIAYRGLRSGLHDFHFKVDGGLFRAFGSTEIKDGDCDVSVALERGESMLTLDVPWTGVSSWSATGVWKTAMCQSITRDSCW